jgi:hypothetical protein
MLHEKFNPRIRKISGTPKAFFPASGNFPKSRKHFSIRREAFRNPESISSHVGKLFRTPKAFFPAPYNFSESRKYFSSRREAFQNPESFPEAGKILSGFRKSFPPQVKILSGFRNGFRKGKQESAGAEESSSKHISGLRASIIPCYFRTRGQPCPLSFSNSRFSNHPKFRLVPIRI